MPSPDRNSTSLERIGTVEREAEALHFRKGGMTYDQIAAQMGFSHRSAARKAVKRALEETLQEPADELRRMECERLDQLLLAMWPKALEGSTWHVDRCLAISERRARLLGLDAPTRRVVDLVTHDAFAQALEGLEAEVGALEGSGDRSDPPGNRAGEEAAQTEG